MFRISRLAAVVATLVAVLTTGVTWWSDDPRRAADAGLYEEQAYRLATTGDFVRPQEDEGWRVHDGERYSTHPVGYVVYLAAIYLSYPAIGELSAECITDTGCRPGQPVRDRMRFAGSAMRGIAAAAVVLVTALFSANMLLALAAGVVCMVLMMAQWDTPAVMAGGLLLAHAALAAKAWQRPSIRVGVLSGLALGALVLVRSIYLYSLVIVPLVWLAGIWLIPSQRRRTAPAFVALTLSACVVVAPWMTRNWVQGGAFAVSAGGGLILAIRAEYGLMTWPEVGSAFAYFLPTHVPFRASAMRRLTAGPNGYVRFNRDDERSYYRRTLLRAGRVASLADAADPEWRTASIARQDAALSAAAMAVYREHWLKQIALTVVFLHRGTGRRRVAPGCAAVPASGVPPPGLQAGLPVGSDALDGRDVIDRHALHCAVLVPVYSCGNGAPGAGSSGPVGVRSRVEGTRDI